MTKYTYEDIKSAIKTGIPDVINAVDAASLWFGIKKESYETLRDRINEGWWDEDVMPLPCEFQCSFRDMQVFEFNHAIEAEAVKVYYQSL